MNILNAIYKNRKIILKVVKGVAFVGSVYFSAKETPEALVALDKAEHDKCLKYREEHPEDPDCNGYTGLTKLEMIKYGAPKYWKTALCAGIAIGSDCAVAKITEGETETIKMLLSLALSDNDRNMKIVEDVVSKDKLNKIKSQIAQEKINENPPKIDTTFNDDGTHTFCIFGQYFRSTRNSVDAIFNKINAKINQGETFSQDMICLHFGVSEIKGGSNILYGRCAGIPGDILDYDVNPAEDIYGNPVSMIEIKNKPEVL